MEQKLKESQPALPLAHVVFVDDIEPASKDDLAQNIADLSVSFSQKVHVAADPKIVLIPDANVCKAIQPC